MSYPEPKTPTQLALIAKALKKIPQHHVVSGEDLAQLGDRLLAMAEQWNEETNIATAVSRLKEEKP